MMEADKFTEGIIQPRLHVGRDRPLRTHCWEFCEVRATLIYKLSLQWRCGQAWFLLRVVMTELNWGRCSPAVSQHPPQNGHTGLWLMGMGENMQGRSWKTGENLWSFFLSFLCGFCYYAQEVPWTPTHSSNTHHFAPYCVFYEKLVLRKQTCASLKPSVRKKHHPEQTNKRTIPEHAGDWFAALLSPTLSVQKCFGKLWRIGALCCQTQSISEGAALRALGGCLGTAKELNNSHRRDACPEEQTQLASILQPVSEDSRVVGAGPESCRES